MSDKATEPVEPQIADEATLDAHQLCVDFPIFQQRFRGKPFAYHDPAISAQKPRQVLDALSDFYNAASPTPGYGKRGAPG